MPELLDPAPGLPMPELLEPEPMLPAPLAPVPAPLAPLPEPLPPACANTAAGATNTVDRTRDMNVFRMTDSFRLLAHGRVYASS
jgi:hypothetical protein